MTGMRLNKLRNLIKDKGLEAILIMQPENRRYISGFTGTAGTVLFTLNKAYLLTDFRYVEQAKEQAPDFSVIDPGSEIFDKINRLLQEQGVKNLAFEEDYVSYQLYKKLKEKLDVKLIPTSGLLEELRKIKDKVELNLIKQAILISDRAFNHILGYIKPGVTERDVSLELEFFMKKQGAEKLAFTTIVASGKRASLPHGVASNKKIEMGDLVTMDFGAVYKGYNSDITRTVCVGNPDEKQKEIYNLVLKAQQVAEEKIKVGMICKEADAIARDIIEKAGYGEYFGHGLGHGVGLAVHEKPTLSFNNSDELKEGMVVTVEPGVYIPDWGGIRIEDIVLITNNGPQVLTRASKDFISL